MDAQLYRFPTREAAEAYLADLKARGIEVIQWGTTPDPAGPGVLLAIETK